MGRTSCVISVGLCEWQHAVGLDLADLTKSCTLALLNQVPICGKLAHIQTRAAASDRAVSLGWRGWANSGTVLEME